jgi:hypothetical protein
MRVWIWQLKARADVDIDVDIFDSRVISKACHFQSSPKGPTILATTRVLADTPLADALDEARKRQALQINALRGAEWRLADWQFSATQSASTTPKPWPCLVPCIGSIPCSHA